MHELAKVTLENEMDLILAHKRSMKLAEIADLSLSAQTTFATAVSEVARNIIESGKKGCLVLNVDLEQREKYIVACLKDEHANEVSREGLEFARRLVSKYKVTTKGAETSIELFFYISPLFKIDIYKLDEWRSLFRNEPPISPYEELKRKNEQLQDLSDKVQKSETQYKTLTNSLPIIIFSLDRDGQLLYVNDWLYKYSGQTKEGLNKNRWKAFIHEDDYDAFLCVLKNDIPFGTATIRLQARLKNGATNEFQWHQISLTPSMNGDSQLKYWSGFIVDIHAQKIVEETLKDNVALKQIQFDLKEAQQAQEKYIDELNRSNQELQQFAFIASHDLQEPVRKILYFSDYILSHYSKGLEGKGQDYLEKMRNSADRMRRLITDLLVFSQINKGKSNFLDVDLNKVIDFTLQDFEIAIKEKGATFTVAPLPVIKGDERMLVQLFENLISNSLKYSKKDVPPHIHVGSKVKDGFVELSIADNGIGFDEKYLTQMFTLFQRLHNQAEYQGTGLGLAICRKITDIHNGSIWAEAKEGIGATFFISFPEEAEANS